MAALDYLVIAAYLLLTVGLSLAFTRRGSSDASAFFLSGRSLPWYIAGTTMVATTFAADTPLAVTELVAAHGISGNWLWWNMMAGTALAAFLFAPLWRRAGILTDVEFIEFRYSGRPASFLRGFKAVYIGVFFNIIVMAWVNAAMAAILQHLFGIPESLIFPVLLGLMLLVALYSSFSGLTGIAFTDTMQFILAMGGTLVLALFILETPAVGGLSGLREQLPDATFHFFPTFGNVESVAAAGIMTLTLPAFIAHMGIQWWSSWYPGSEPGGGGYIAQRMMSAKDERHSMMATLWFTIAHYAVRPWPWIIVALASLVLYPELGADEKKAGFVLAMKDHLPAGVKGILVAAFLSAYMSTISTHLNWGSSYLVHDLYRRFLRPDKPEKHYVTISRLSTLLLALLAAVGTLMVTKISGAWGFLIECGAGMGAVLILRWYWWRLNAWSEITAILLPLPVMAVLRFMNIGFPHSLFYIVGISMAGWIAVTFLTKPDDEATLQRFHDRVKPAGPGWRPFQSEINESLLPHVAYWLISVALVYSALFGVGALLFHTVLQGLLLLGSSVVLFITLMNLLRRQRY